MRLGFEHEAMSARLLSLGSRVRYGFGWLSSRGGFGRRMCVTAQSFDRNKKEPEGYAVCIDMVVGTQKPKITAEGLREVGVETENQRDWADS